MFERCLSCMRPFDAAGLTPLLSRAESRYGIVPDGAVKKAMTDGAVKKAMTDGTVKKP